ncbi:MAG TPA: hypothetical protein VLA88_05520 [Candidatus Saccharimonadales bacterium]|nr:hypothetical protein [Candidatus Saccharimonadales bacterium]
MTGGAVQGPQNASLNLALGGDELEITITPHQLTGVTIHAAWPEANRDTVAKHLPTDWEVITRQNRCRVTAEMEKANLATAVALVREIFSKVQPLPPTGFWYSVTVPGREGDECEEVISVDVMGDDHRRLSIARFEPGPFQVPGKAEEDNTEPTITDAFMEALRASDLCVATSVQFVVVDLHEEEAEPVPGIESKPKVVTGEVTVKLREDSAENYIGSITTLVGLYAKSRSV